MAMPAPEACDPDGQPGQEHDPRDRRQPRRPGCGTIRLATTQAADMTMTIPATTQRFAKPGGPPSFIPGQGEEISRPAGNRQIGRLGVASEHLKREDRGQLGQGGAPTLPQETVGRPQTPWQPRGADHENRIAILEQDGRTERIAEGADQRAHPARSEGAAQGQHPEQCDDRMRDRVKPHTPA